MSFSTFRMTSRGLASAFKSKARTTTAKTISPFLLRHFSDKKHPLDGPYDYSYGGSADPRFEENKPTLKYATGMPHTFSVMRHEQIIQLCVEGSYNARREAMIRNVMSVDQIEYDEAVEVVKEIAKENRRLMSYEYFPYHAGIGVALAGGIFTWPMIFHKNTALWFNDNFVTTEIPDVADLETIWEVGGWTWGWMEPAIGQASFFLLVLQFARSQALKLGIKPYGNAMLSARSSRLKAKYPQYNTMFLEWYSQSEAMYGSVVSD